MTDDGGSTGPVVIVGTGLIGSSIGMALTSQGREVHLQDSQADHELIAAGLGAGLVGVVEPTHVSLVIVAVPPAVAGQVVINALAKYPAATVTDVASVKSSIVEAVEGHSGADRYVGSHPMAGSQRSGPLTSRPDLFADRTWVITPHAGTRQDSIDTVKALAISCGARVEIMSPEEHDVAVAEVSHVPQIMSSLMAGSLVGAPPEHLRLAGQGVRDVTRIAGSQPDMWTQIIGANRKAIGDELSRIAASLEALVSHLDSPSTVHRFLEQGVAGVKTLPGKHGRVATDYTYVTVEIPDSPGALARLFADVNDAGVNVEDLRIEHDEDREVGYLAMAIEPVQADHVSQVMVERGWVLKD